MQNIPTVTIRRDDMDVRINASDYDADRDGEILAHDDVPVLAAPPVPQIVADPVETLVPAGAPDAPAQPVAAPDAPAQPVAAPDAPAQPVAAPDAPAQPPKAVAVVKRGRKFFATDAQGQDVPGFNASGYAQEQEAWDAILKAGSNA